MTLSRRLTVGLVVLLVASGCGWFDRDDPVGLPPAATATSTAASTEAVPTVTQTPPGSPVPESTSETTPEPAAEVPVIDLSQPSTRLAFFHTISEKGDAPDLLAREAAIVILTSGDEPYRDALRQAGYSGMVLQYLNASQVNGPGPYRDSQATCDASFVPLRNGIVRGKGVFCRDVHPNEDWFLHNGAGERLYSLVGETEVHYHMNPGNPGWQAYASGLIAGQLIGPQAAGYDGVLLDNVELSLTRLIELAVNADGRVKEFDSDDAFREAWTGYLSLIRARGGAGATIWASLVSDPNQGDYWSDYLVYLDGVMSPAFATGYDPLRVDQWENNLNQAETALGAGKELIAVSRGNRDDLQWQQFAVASYLLIADDEQSWFRYVARESSAELITLWQYPNYEIALGPPTGPRMKSGSTWRRTFVCGYVEVHPARQTGKIVQTECESGMGS